jgi:osmotically-inducible protein OsmY
MLDTNQTVEDSQRRARGWIILGVLLLGLLFFLCTCRDSRLIQADLWAKGRAALEFKGYDPNILSMNGRDATLTGTVPTEAIKADAEAVIRSINGIRQVAFQNNLAVGDVPAVAEADTAPTPNLVPLRGPSLNMSIAAGTVTLSGLVAGGSRPQIIEAATELYGEGNVIDNLEVADDVEQPSWLAGALGLLPQVKNEVQEGTLTATSDGITLSGTAASEQAKAGLAAAASSATGLEVNNKLVVATLELKPATFALRLNNGKAELSGTVPEATIAGAVEAASRAVGAENVVNTLQAAADIAAPSWSVGLFGALPSLVKVAPDLGINVVDKTLTLTGTVPSPQMRESLAKQVQDAVGAEVTVANQLQVAEQTPPQLRVKFTPDAVQLSGTVSQSTADSALQMAGTLSGSVVNQMTVAENVAQPAWLPGLLEQLPTFAKGVQEGEVVLQGSTITLVGAVVSEEQKTAVETSIRQAVGADPTITNQLRVVAPVVEVQPALNLKLADNALTLSGNVAQATAEQMMEAVTNLPDTTLTNQLTTADNVAQPEWLPDIIGLVPTYTITVQNAELDLKDNQITLAGVVASEAEKTEMGTQFTNAVGEGAQVINNLQVEAAEPAQVRVTVENGVATLAGNLPEDTASSIASSLAETPDTTVTNEIIAGSSVSMPTWLESVLELLPDMTTEVSNADVNIEGNTITLAGTVPSEEKKTELANELTQAAGAEVEVVNNLTVEEVAPPEPVQLRVQIQDGVATVTGNVPEATATQVVEAADAAPETTSVTNEIEAAPNVQVPTWLPSVVEVLPEATRDIADADVSIVADTITLAGVAPNEERKTEITETIKQAAGADVNVVNNIEVAEEPVAETPVAEAPVQPSESEAVETETPQAETPTAETAPTDTAQAETTQVETPEAETTAQSETSTPTEQTSQAETPQADTASVQEDAPLAEVPSDAGEIETPPAETSQAATSESVTPQAEASPTPEEPVATVDESNQVETSQAATPTTEPTPEQEETPEPVVVTPTPTRNPEVRIEIVGNTIRLTGTVPSEESVALAAAPYSKETVENLLTATSDVANATWLPKLYEIAPQVASDLNRATLVLSDTTLTIQGTAPSVEQRDAIGKYVNDAFQGELTVINRLTVQEPLPVTEDGK